MLNNHHIDNRKMKTRILQPLWNRPNLFNLILMCFFLCTMVLISLNIGDRDTLTTRNISIKRPLIATPQYKSSFDLSMLEDNDMSQLIDLTDFKFLINNSPCQKSSAPSSSSSISSSLAAAPVLASSQSSSSSLLKAIDGSTVIQSNSNSPEDDSNSVDIFLLIFIHSAPKNFEKRKTIRDTWASFQNVSSLQVRRIFLLGLVGDVELQKLIENENSVHGDIVQGNFIDTYRNLTYKHVMGLKWITYYCRSAKFILKADDDIFVDTYQLINHLKGLMIDPITQPRKLINCFVIRNPYPARSDKSKWKVTYEEYPGKYYPTYCFGWSVILSPDAVFNLYLESKGTPYFWVDDVYVTGLLAQKASIDQIDLGPKLALTDQEINRWVKAKGSLTVPPMFARPDAIKDLQTIYDLWNKTIRYYKFVSW